MALTDAEFATILADESKRVRGDVTWKEDEDRSPAMEFRVDIESTNGWPLFVKGRYNAAARTLTYALILKTTGAHLRPRLGEGPPQSAVRPSRGEAQAPLDGAVRR